MLEILFQRTHILLQRFQLRLFVVYARYHRCYRRFPIADRRPVFPRRMRCPHGRHPVPPTKLASIAPTASNAERIRAVELAGQLIVRDRAGVRVRDAVPAIFHVGDAPRERFFARPSGPVVARRDPFVDELFRACLEEIEATVGEGQHHAMRPLFAVARRRQRVRQGMREVDGPN